jgi:23S rRNA G2069 N7-methylase RlmK/C1962 C5-methylase RlmI
VWHNINGKRTWVEPALEGDARFDVDIVRDPATGFGYLDHRKAAGAWDEQTVSERERAERG